MLKILVVVISLLELSHSVVGQVFFSGECNSTVPAVVTNFNVTQFLGTWHVVEAYPSEFELGTCRDATYSLGVNGTVDVLNTEVVNQTLSTILGNAEAATDGSGRLFVTINSTTEASNLWVLDTDYGDFALLYSCANVNNATRAVWSWKMSRSRTLSATAITRINTIINETESVDLDASFYEPVDNTADGCFYVPERSLNSPLRFRSTCAWNSLNIPLQQNFNVTGYLGLWNVIESYPSWFQVGTCTTATYALGDSGVDVINAQVINQTLDTINGFAVVASLDLSANLTVTLPIAGTNLTIESSLYVLGTDYINYAIAYSCVDLEDGFSEVYSWKMSRTKELSPASVAAISNVTGGVDVLQDHLYLREDHTPEGCFYVPERSLNSPLRFRSTCAWNSLNIPLEQNFNVTEYLGLWNVIESYPSWFQVGTCTTATYALGDSGVDVINAQVINQTLDTINGFAVVASLDSSANLTVTLPIVGTNLTTESSLYVLGTDYINYAIAYSCIDLEDGFSEVYSWKMSRTKELSPASVAAIYNVTSGVNVLHDHLYLEEDQTPEGCFHFPEPRPGTPVVFPGQCDPNIAVINNFNLTAFSGVWYEIEAYPTGQQIGDCINHDITVADVNDTLNVVSSRVIDTSIVFSNSSLTSIFNDSSSFFIVSINGTEFPVWIIDTDYTDYALAYSCSNLGNFSREVFSWKLSRNSYLSNASIAAIANATATIDVLEDKYFESIDQSINGCFHYPEFEELPGAITLLGPCPAISGVANFSASQYMGKWFEIERYPQPNQNGQCNRVEYTPLTGVLVDVLNSHVVNRTLVYQSGMASASGDTGDFIVIFSVNGVNRLFEFNVLATDYDNYALAYSCRNLTNGNRQVFSWKLSRNTTLSAEANNTINEVMERTQGLQQQYFMSTDQSEQACFYIPQVNRQQEVLLRGSCPTVTGEANFNLQRYLGWWHEERSYPTGRNTGDCISSRYQLVGNQIEFEDTQIFGTVAQISRGTVQANTNGFLTKTFANGQQEGLWVLGTDYENYALLYRCDPTNDPEYVRVYSAVQSKTRNLTPNNQQAIALLIANNNLLQDSLFLPVSQTAEACFHHPEPAAIGERVILRGQCDPNIPVQNDFRISDYAGTWYLTEKYPYPEVSENAACIGTRYTTAGQNSVNILNWKVENGDLFTVSGQAAVNQTLAELAVTINPNTPDNTTATLSVLTTDYNTFSLMYTCANINAFERAVVAFKLSRSRSLPAAAITAINNYMATRQELHQPYFLTVPQPDTCQDPSSSYLVKSSIIVVLLCALLNMFS